MATEGRPSPGVATLRIAGDESPARGRPSPMRAVAVLVVWAASVAGLVYFRWVGARVAFWLPPAAAAANLVALLVAWAVSVGRIPRFVARALPAWIAALAGPFFVLVCLTGGLRSPAIFVAGLVVLGIAWQRGLPAGASLAVGLLAAILVADLAIGRRFDAPWLAAVAFSVLSLGLIPVAHARRAVAEESRARQRLARVEGYLADRRMTPLGSNAIVSPDDLKSEKQAQFQTAEGLRHIDALDRYLRDVRDTMGADEVIFWRFNEARQTQRAAAWSTEGASAPRYFEREAWGPLVRWAAESGQVQAVSDADVVFFVVAPVRDGARVHGAISVASRAGLTHTPDGARRWVARHAAHAAVLLDLLDLRREASRHLLSTPALVKAAERLQAAKTTDALGIAICQTAIEVTSAQRSALVRWDPEHETGTVMAVSRGHVLAPGLAIDGDSLVAEQCSMRKLLHKEDARVLRGAVVYGRGEGKRELGGLAVVPLARAEIGVIGAIVIESDQPDVVSRREVENVNLLGVIAARSLETAWEIEEEWRRARTDPLTGLHNRRHFDEQMGRIVSESLAHGTPAALIVADVDHFKRVNDTYGHEAGDAVLKAVARVFLDCLRAEDVCARYGGEEIAVILPETGVDRAHEVADRVRRAIEGRAIVHGDRTIRVTASFGVAGYPESTALRDAVFPSADRALYEAKAAGRNRVQVAAAPAHGRGSQS